MIRVMELGFPRREIARCEERGFDGGIMSMVWKNIVS